MSDKPVVWKRFADKDAPKMTRGELDATWEAFDEELLRHMQELNEHLDRIAERVGPGCFEANEHIPREPKP